jgi:hypothetical protein
VIFYRTYHTLYGIIYVIIGYKGQFQKPYFEITPCKTGMIVPFFLEKVNAPRVLIKENAGYRWGGRPPRSSLAAFASMLTLPPMREAAAPATPPPCAAAAGGVRVVSVSLA